MRIFFVIKLKSAIRIILFTVAAIICIGVLLATILNLQAVDVFKTAGKDLPIYYVDTQEKKVAITFDCAWGDGDIPQILDTLKKENVGATFFLVGRWAEKFPETVKMIAGAGHDVANHGYSHLRMGALDSGSINKELTLCSQKLAEITGAKVELFRPPYGDYSNNVVLAAKKQGLYTIQWDVDTIYIV